MDIPSASVLHTRLMARARLRHLQLFAKLAELGNLKRSAEALSLSQPAATQLLADLEQLLELRLFDRHSRGVRITAAGDALLPMARRSLEAMAEGSEALTAIRRQGEGQVRVAALTGAISGLLVRALPAFARERPAIQIQVQESDSDRCAEQVSRREVDLAVCREPAAMPAGCRFDALLPDRFVVACGTAHPLVGRKRLPWSALAREHWLLPPVQSAARRAFDERMAALGASPTVHSVVTRVSALTWAMLQADHLLTLAPLGVVRQLVEAGQLAVLDLEADLPFGPLGLLMQDSGTRQAARVFVDHLQQFVRHHP